jgi:hypothetical protein
VYDARVFLPDTKICEGASELYWPVVISNRPASDDVYAFELSLEYDSAYVSFEGFVQAGTSSEGWSAAVNNTFGEGWQRSRLDIACSGTTPVSDAGPLCYLKFTAKPALRANYSTNLNLSRLVLNEGTPTALIDNDITLRARSTLCRGRFQFTRNGVGVSAWVTLCILMLMCTMSVKPTYQWYINNLEVLVRQCRIS